jgi:hypothetical protein
LRSHQMPTVAAVVVTRNRPKLVERCLAAIYAQSDAFASEKPLVDGLAQGDVRDLLRGSDESDVEALLPMLSFNTTRGGGRRYMSVVLAGFAHGGVRQRLRSTCAHRNLSRRVVERSFIALPRDLAYGRRCITVHRLPTPDLIKGWGDNWRKRHAQKL